ncbi:hypothetical protein ONZ45_g16263 [Pleurotus djamor]|nr:hypothetical protein ONZ45_g16263 [Pleurotus djamor]
MSAPALDFIAVAALDIVTDPKAPAIKGTALPCRLGVSEGPKRGSFILDIQIHCFEFNDYDFKYTLRRGDRAKVSNTNDAYSCTFLVGKVPRNAQVAGVHIELHVSFLRNEDFRAFCDLCAPCPVESLLDDDSGFARLIAFAQLIAFAILDSDDETESASNFKPWLVQQTHCAAFIDDLQQLSGRHAPFDPSRLKKCLECSEERRDCCRFMNLRRTRTKSSPPYLEHDLRGSRFTDFESDNHRQSDFEFRSEFNPPITASALHMLKISIAPALLATIQDDVEAVRRADDVLPMRKSPQFKEQCVPQIISGIIPPEKFHDIWSLGLPFLVHSSTRPTLQWSIMDLADVFGDDPCYIEGCSYDSRGRAPRRRKTTVRHFFTHHLMGNQRSAVKLKDYPTATTFGEKVPAHARDFFSTLPLPQYTAHQGPLNIAAFYPMNYLSAPDLGPKMYAATASTKNGQHVGSTRLHMDMADAVNIMMNDGVALWHIFRPEDAQSLRSFLAHLNRLNGSDPINEQKYYLTAPQLDQLHAQWNVDPLTFEQRMGDCVFIPAGCAHQVSNTTSCIKVALDFLSPQSLTRCRQVAYERRISGMADDCLELNNLLIYAWYALRALETANVAVSLDAEDMAMQTDDHNDDEVADPPNALPPSAPPSPNASATTSVSGTRSTTPHATIDPKAPLADVAVSLDAEDMAMQTDDHNDDEVADPPNALPPSAPPSPNASATTSVSGTRSTTPHATIDPKAPPLAVTNFTPPSTSTVGDNSQPSSDERRSGPSLTSVTYPSVVSPPSDPFDVRGTLSVTHTPASRSTYPRGSGDEVARGLSSADVASPTAVDAPSLSSPTTVVHSSPRPSPVKFLRSSTSSIQNVRHAATHDYHLLSGANTRLVSEVASLTGLQTYHDRRNQAMSLVVAKEASQSVITEIIERLRTISSEYDAMLAAEQLKEQNHGVAKDDTDYEIELIKTASRDQVRTLTTQLEKLLVQEATFVQKNAALREEMRNVITEQAALPLPVSAEVVHACYCKTCNGADVPNQTHKKHLKWKNRDDALERVQSAIARNESDLAASKSSSLSRAPPETKLAHRDNTPASPDSEPPPDRWMPTASRMLDRATQLYEETKAIESISTTLPVTDFPVIESQIDTLEGIRLDVIKLKTDLDILKKRRLSKPAAVVLDHAESQISSLSHLDWLASLLARPGYEEMMDKAWDNMEIPKDGHISSMFQGRIIRDFKGSDGLHFSQSGDENAGRYLFTVCGDWFNPLTNKIS